MGVIPNDGLGVPVTLFAFLTCREYCLLEMPCRGSAGESVLGRQCKWGDVGPTGGR